MPLRKWLVRRAPPVRAGLRQPIQIVEIGAIELHAVGDALHPVLVIEATPVPAVEQLAGNIGGIEQPRLLVLELVDAAAAAPVAQSFPLTTIERGERFLPKRRAAVHGKSSLALLTLANQAGKRG